MSIFEELNKRNLIAQITHEGPIEALLKDKKVTVYLGIDPTADSLHLGHLIALLTLKRFQQWGHRIIALVGGGTAMIGDPSGKTELRQIMTEEIITSNKEAIRKQISRFVNIDDHDKGIMVDNSDWIRDLNYVTFLREIGIHFTVNRMLAAECYKTRMEQGLTFIEFNYMLLQSYDFLLLNRKYNCTLQIGGDDQWSNILAGADLVRRIEKKEVYGLTIPLLLTSDGKKMGKTEKGSVWLSRERTTPYEFYQYWRNVEDLQVIKLLKMLTFIPLEKIEEFSHFEGKDLNIVKKELAFSLTETVHGKEEADKAMKASEALFEGGRKSESIPVTEISRDSFEKGIRILDALSICGLIGSKGEGRRLIQQAGIQVNDNTITDNSLLLDNSFLEEGKIKFRKGKKVYHFLKVI
ncbi:MAG TPA: tyrosine--tRNA ligase [Candidatus Eremiobacteraeota bacterium]|nr:MAG: Tyrosine--tRNA ligase [bacterium ADurb.Bin363]HPZ07198.1 tyrosine--tRNA ligase [Candidatus Eremiobacteraeota bacterium]